MDMSSHPQPKIDAFHKARSVAIDAFADLESALLTILRKAGISVACQLFGQRIELARKEIAAINRAQEGARLTLEVLDSCERLAQLRNDLVHCKMQWSTIDGVSHVGFAPDHECPVGSLKARFLTLPQLKQVKDECDRIAASMRLP